MRWLRLFPLLLLWPASGWAQVVQYYHLDAVGNVLAVTDASGAVVEQHDYLPFGEEWCAGPPAGVCGSVTLGQPRRFTGKERDAETGLDYFGARYYGSRMGRFTSTDPAYTWRDNIADPQRWNRYVYVRNNPLRYVDPDGRELTVTPEARTVINSITMRGDANSERVKATLELFDHPGKPDLHIELGDVGKDPSGLDSDAVFVPRFRVSVVGATTFEEGSITFDKAQPPKAGDATSEWIVRHELGHADLAARDPAEYRRLEVQSKSADGSLKKHQDRPIEHAADTYAGGPDPRLSGKKE